MDRIVTKAPVTESLHQISTRAAAAVDEAPDAERRGLSARITAAAMAALGLVVFGAPPATGRAVLTTTGDGVYVVICVPGGMRTIRLDEDFFNGSGGAAPGEDSPFDDQTPNESPGGHGACHAIRGEDRKSLGERR
ncbi:MAG: hypothetical protein AAFX08_04400 [Pseudomonadota bacterium]